VKVAQPTDSPARLDGARPTGRTADPLFSRQDLDHVLDCTRPLWDDLRGRRVFFTGGTGFVGAWLLATFAWANAELGLGAQATVLSRDPERFAGWAPQLAADPSIAVLRGDVRSFAFPDGRFDHIVHAASQEPTSPDASGSVDRFEADVAGTRHVLEFARQAHASRLLFTSSGAVYGPQPPELERVTEEYRGAPDALDPHSAYAQAKRVSEFLCAALAADTGIACVVARCFAFVGPLLPLDREYASGNFIRDAMRGGPIEIRGDGTPYRSYLYAADLAVWLWTALFSGRSCRPYNVGSGDALTILDLARTVAAVAAPDATVTVGATAPAGRPAARYVPSVERARDELGLTVRIDLEDALRRTIAWHSRREERPR
jgi:nucleoside-diphosphate-sugar epimerase